MTLPAEARDAALLLDMLSWAAHAGDFVAGLNEAGFRASKLHQAAVVRCIEVVGEAAARISPGFKAGHPDIPWPLLVGMRNRLIHDYGRISLDIVWQVVRDDLPALAARLRPLVPPDTGP